MPERPRSEPLDERHRELPAPTAHECVVRLAGQPHVVGFDRHDTSEGIPGDDNAPVVSTHRRVLPAGAAPRRQQARRRRQAQELRRRATTAASVRAGLAPDPQAKPRTNPLTTSGREPTSGSCFPRMRNTSPRVQPGTRRMSAVEHRPADLVSQPLIVQDEFANRLRQLFALPLALEPAGALSPRTSGAAARAALIA